MTEHRAFGTDRVAPGTEPGRLVLSCRHEKGWRARTDRTRLSVEHPGTAIRWEESLYEVVEAELLAAGGARYTLAPWEDRHIARDTSTYDEEGERSREEARAKARMNDARRRTAVLLAPLAGHLPAAIQARMESEYDAPAAGMTIASALPLFAVGSLASVWLAISSIAGIEPGIPRLLLLAGAYFFVESGIRLSLAWNGGQPCGSVLGTVAWLLWCLYTKAVTRSRRVGGSPASRSSRISPRE